MLSTNQHLLWTNTMMFQHYQNMIRMTRGCHAMSSCKVLVLWLLLETTRLSFTNHALQSCQRHTHNSCFQMCIFLLCSCRPLRHQGLDGCITEYDRKPPWSLCIQGPLCLFTFCFPLGWKLTSLTHYTTQVVYSTQSTTEASSLYKYSLQ